MNTLPLVSVIMPVYNGEAYLKEAIESMLSQTYASFEFIIIDDGSTDDTATIIQSFAAKDQRIVMINNEINLGLTKSLNKGIKLVRGEFVARMDADDVSWPDRIGNQVNFLINNPDHVCVGSDTDLINIAGKKIGMVRLPHADCIHDYIRKRNCFVHGTLMVKLSALLKIGGYDENYQLAQDYRLLLRLAHEGKLGNVDKVLYSLRKRGDSLSVRQFFKQCYFTALAKTQDQMLPVIFNKLYKPMLIKNYFYSFFIIYKAGVPAVMRILKIIK